MAAISIECVITKDSPIDLSALVFNLERLAIVEALHETKNVRSQAAVLLGLKRTTLVAKMRRHGLELYPPWKKGFKNVDSRI